MGGAFHIVGGGIVRARGRSTLQVHHIAKEAAFATGRVGAVFAGYTALRAGAQAATGSDALACMGAGAAVVATATAANPARVTLLQASLAAAMRQPRSAAGAVPMHLVLAAAAASGAFTLGGVDLVLHHAGLAW